MLKGKTLTFPPTTAQGHIEQWPEQAIVGRAIPDAIQRHILEHSEGNGPPGTIIQYNCEQFSCESDLVDKLANIAAEYPNTVYVAPGPKYDGKIIMTKLGASEVLEAFDAEKIRQFISGKRTSGLPANTPVQVKNADGTIPVSTTSIKEEDAT